MTSGSYILFFSFLSKSFHGDRKTFKEIIDAYDWTFCQIQYNFMDENVQAGKEGLQYAASKNIAVMIMEPLRGGMLAGKLPKKIQEIYDHSLIKRTPAEWALMWIWNHPEVTVVLSGMNEEIQLQENIRTCESAIPGSMSASELTVIKEVSDAYRQQIKVGCTGCAYCMPCPFGVNIPLCFSSYNDYHMGVLNNGMIARAMYAGFLMWATGGKPVDASLCRNCGKCTKKCPQNIAIPSELKKVNNDLGGLRTKLMIPLVRFMMPTEVKE